MRLSDYIEKMAMSENRIEDIVNNIIGDISVTNPNLGMKIKPLLTNEEDQTATNYVKDNARFATKHPVITGIPTLGIWPMLSQARIEDRTGKYLRRMYPCIDQRMREREIEKINEYERLQALHIANAQEQGKSQRVDNIADKATYIAAMLGAAMQNK